MSRTLGSVRNYAPYVFLAKNTADGKYKVFVIIPYEAGQRVSSNSTNPAYLNGTTRIEFTITADANVTTAGKYFKGFTLDPVAAASSGSYVFNAATFCVEVKTERSTVISGNTVTITHTNKVFYDSADENAPVSGDVSYDCPYLYLTNPNAGTGGSSSEYTPFCLVPLQSYEENTQSYDNSIDSSEGQCRQEILMKTHVTSGKTEIAPGDITANTRTYNDPGTIEGYFEVILNYPVALGQPRGNDKKRKGRIKNASSDPNPTTFID